MTLVITLAIAILSGLTGGWLATRECFGPSGFEFFRDDDHIEDVMHKYPVEFLEGDYDCIYEHGSADDVKNALIKLRSRFFPDDGEAALKKVMDKVWNGDCSAKENFRNFVKKGDHTITCSDTTFDELFDKEDKDTVMKGILDFTSE